MLHNVSGLPVTTTWQTASASLLEWNKDVSFLLLITHATGWSLETGTLDGHLPWLLRIWTWYPTAIQKKLLRKNLKTNLFPENLIYSGCAQMTFWGVFIHPFLFLFVLCCCSMHIFAFYKSSSTNNQHKDMQEKKKKKPRKNKQSPPPPPEIAVTATWGY